VHVALLLAVALLARPVDAAADGAAAEASAIAAGVNASLAREVARRSTEQAADPWTLLAPLVVAARSGAPQEPVASKVLEGLAKRVRAERVAEVARRLAERLAPGAPSAPGPAPAPPPSPRPATPLARSH
jgi:hypothetical protein